jgi:tRNA (guanine-N7-)-methyltransferase
MAEHPPTRTFKPRRRPLSSSRSATFDRLAPRFLLDELGLLLALDDVFGRPATIVLDIGIGLGDTTIAMAVAQPELDVIGCDVHTPGIAHALAAIEEHDLTNVRLVHGDALEFLRRLAPASLTGVRAFFPDPWPKARHHHRRLVRVDVVDRLVERLRPSGWMHLATDIDDYAVQMQRVCDAHPELSGGPIERPAGRPLTRYERRGIAAGHTVTDLWYDCVRAR